MLWQKEKLHEKNTWYIMQGYMALMSENIEELQSHLWADSTTVFNKKFISMGNGRENYHIF